MLRVLEDVARCEGAVSSGSSSTMLLLRILGGTARCVGAVSRGSSSAVPVSLGVSATPRGLSGGKAWTRGRSVFKKGSCRVWGSSTHDWTPSYRPRLTCRPKAFSLLSFLRDFLLSMLFAPVVPIGASAWKFLQTL